MLPTSSATGIVFGQPKESLLPVVRIDIQEGKSTVYKRALLNGVRSALVSALNIPDERVMQRIVETAAENVDASDIRSDRLTVVEVSMVGGRGVELKERLYYEIAGELRKAPGIDAHDLVVIINDPPGECFFINGTMQCQPTTSTGEK
jgi:phenylpyruvate tautomerase PptA (4-oxalocrotonate tautomerase family)